MRRRLRIILGESIVELGEFLIGTGQMVRDIGGFCLPDYEGHPSFALDSRDAPPRRYRVPAS